MRTSADSIPELPALGDGARMFEFSMDQLVPYVTSLKAQKPASMFGCFSSSKVSGKALAKATKRASDFFLAASLFGITYRRGQVSGNEPYLICIPLDRVSLVNVGTMSLSGLKLMHVEVAVAGEDTRLDIVGLKHPEEFQDCVLKLQLKLVNNLKSLGLPIVPSLSMAISRHRSVKLNSFLAESSSGDASVINVEPGLRYIKQHLNGRQPTTVALSSLGGGSLSGGGLGGFNYSPLSSFATHQPRISEASSLGMAAYLYEATAFELEEYPADKGGRMVPPGVQEACTPIKTLAMAVQSHVEAPLQSGDAREEEAATCELSSGSIKDQFANPLYNVRSACIAQLLDLGALNRSAIKDGLLKPSYVVSDRLCLKMESAAQSKGDDQAAEKAHAAAVISLANGEGACGIVSLASKELSSGAGG